MQETVTDFTRLGFGPMTTFNHALHIPLVAYCLVYIRLPEDGVYNVCRNV